MLSTPSPEPSRSTVDSELGGTQDLLATESDQVESGNATNETIAAVLTVDPIVTQQRNMNHQEEVIGNDGEEDEDDDEEDAEDEAAIEDEARRNVPEQPATSKAEILAWINYDFASTVFPSVAMAVFIPLILEQMAYNVGRVPGSRDTPCNGAIVPPPLNATDPSGLPLVNVTGSTTTDTSSPCEVYFGPIGYVPTVSFVLYVTSIAVVCQTLVYISLGALADYGRFRKSLLMGLAISGALLTISFLTVVNANLYWFAAILTILANICYGCTLIFYNSYLPVLVQNHPAIRGRPDEWVDLDDVNAELTLLGFSKSFQKVQNKAKERWTRIRKHFLKKQQQTDVATEDQVADVAPETGTQFLQRLAKGPWNQAVVKMRALFARRQATAPTAVPETVTTENGERTEQVRVVTPRPLVQHSRHSSSPAVLPASSILGKSSGPHSRSFSITAAMETTRDVETMSAISDTTRSRMKLQTKLEDRIANTLSTHGLASGQVGVLIVFLISIGLTLVFEDNVYGMQIAVAVAGLWWLLFGILSWRHLKPRPGPPLPKSARNFVLFSWRKTLNSIRRSRRLPNTFFYLLAYFIFSNAFSTIGQLAILFARKTIKMTSYQIAIALILAPIAALSGGYFWLWISRRYNWSTRKMLLILLSLALFLPVYGLLGYIPNTPELVIVAGEGPSQEGRITLGFGLKSVMEMYIAVWFQASFLGAVMSFGRVLYTDLLPREHEAEFFTLYEVLVRGTSWIGPLIVGAIVNGTGGDLRPGFIYVIITMFLAIMILWRCVDVAKGRRECERFVLEEEQLRKLREQKFRQKKMAKRLKKEQQQMRGTDQDSDMMELESFHKDRRVTFDDQVTSVDDTTV